MGVQSWFSECWETAKWVWLLLWEELLLGQRSATGRRQEGGTQEQTLLSPFQSSSSAFYRQSLTEQLAKPIAVAQGQSSTTDRNEKEDLCTRGLELAPALVHMCAHTHT